jgi:hypothetical protein
MDFDPVAVAAPCGPGHVGHCFNQSPIHRGQNALGFIQAGNAGDVGQLVREFLNNVFEKFTVKDPCRFRQAAQ